MKPLWTLHMWTHSIQSCKVFDFQKNKKNAWIATILAPQLNGTELKKNASFKTFYRKQSFFTPIYPSYVCLPVTKKMFQSLRICWFIDGKCPSLEISQSCAFASTSGHVFRQRGRPTASKIFSKRRFCSKVFVKFDKCICWNWKWFCSKSPFIDD